MEWGGLILINAPYELNSIEEEEILISPETVSPGLYFVRVGDRVGKFFENRIIKQNCSFNLNEYFCSIMVERKEILEFFKAYKSELLEKYELQYLALFGSYARQEQNEMSDIDLLIEFNDGVSEIHRKKQELKKEISDKFNVEVDICRDKYIKEYFRNLIYKDAIYF